MISWITICIWVAGAAGSGILYLLGALH